MSRTKAKRGVLVRLVQKDGALGIRLDDAAQVEPSSELWKRMDFVTVGDLDESSFDRMEFDEKALADFGYYVLARLRAYKEVGAAP